jgi:hypothetical protein
MKKILSLLAGGALLLALHHAHAHGVAEPEHGGIIQVVNEIVVELVQRGDVAEVYLKDDDDPMPTAGMSGQLKIAAGGAKSQAVLKPAGGNKLEAKGVRLAQGATVLVIVQLEEKKPRLSASFAIKP